VGIGFFVEKSGLGPFDQVEMTVDSNGNVEVVTGAASLGQGVETAVAQICADALGADIASITVIHGQTDRIARGMGSFATRTTVMTGSATQGAATKLKHRILSIAADLLEVAADDLVIERGQIFVADSPSDPVLTFADIAASVTLDGAAVARHGLGLSSTEEFTSTHMTYPYGLHIAVVKVDVATGIACVERFVVAYDVGRAINPMLIAGQLVGGAAQGIGGALFEEFRFDEGGQPLAASFMDYLLPTAAEIPSVEVLLFEDSPSVTNSLGVKGAGEGGINACGAAIAAAIDDAFGRPGLVTELPITPERLRGLIRRSWGPEESPA
jgi:carbon-monoxide dehydrogenase large subunit/6-hydroxypseudooxynicotine dehydrogenase subunit gamma